MVLRTILLSALCLTAAAGQGTPTPSAPAPSPMQQEVSLYSELPSRGAPVRVGDWNVSVGHLELTKLNGTVTPLTAGGRLLGIHFSGSGSMAYHAADPSEWASLQSNFKRNLNVIHSSVRVAEGLGQATLTENLRSFFLWQTGSPISLPTAEGTGTLPASFDKDWAYFNRDGLGDRGQDFALALGNCPSKRTVRIELTGESFPFLYSFDEGLTQLESLWSIAGPSNPAQYDGLRRILLSQQPIGWSWREPLSALINLTDVDIDLRANLGSAQLKVKETLVVADQGVKVLPLDLYTWRIPEEKRGRYEVSKVLDGSGQPLPFHHRHDRILVELPTAAMPGSPIPLTFEYGGPFLFRPGGDSYWELGTEPWFPQPDLGGQAYTVHALIRTHPKDVPISGGKTLRRERSEEGNLLEVRIDHPVQFFTILAGAYEFVEEAKNGLTIRVAGYGGSTGTAHTKLLNLSRQMIEFYEQLFEKFPFEEFNIVQVNDVGWGQAPPGMMKITNEAFDGKLDDFSAMFTHGINQRFAHEIAHQYWGHLVKMPSSEEQWITEGFANYASALVLKSQKGKGTSAYEGLLSQWRSSADAYSKESTIPFANRLNWIKDPRLAFIGRAALLYDKGGLLLASLHRQMGDAPFALFMKSLLANFRWKFLTTQSVEQVASMAARKDMKPFFQTCYWGTAMPPK